MVMGGDAVSRLHVSRGCWVPELKGRTVIVTGAGRLRSIGRAVALEFARQGTNVVLTGTGRHPDTFPAEEREIGWRDIESVADEIRGFGAEALPLVVDVSDPEAVQAMVDRAVDRFGSVDVLINNAAAGRGGDRVKVVDLPLSEWRKVFRINVEGTLLASQAVARRLIAQGRGGCIVNIASMISRMAPPATAAYSASKSAVSTFSRIMALELAEHRIRVNAVLPGAIDTARVADIEDAARWASVVKSITPLGHAGSGMEIAYFCVYLCSDMAAWITGQDLAVDGGATWR